LLIVNRSDIGRIRQVNEDSVLSGQLNEQVSFAIVADGMGGHQAGDVASQMAIEAFQKVLEQHAELTNWKLEDGKRIMKIAIRQANDEIYELASQKEQYHNMGTTMVAALLWESTMIIGHVGDSRAYRINEEGIQQLTLDHSLVNALIQSGQLTAEEAEHHPRRNVLTRAIGTDSEVEIDVQALDWSTSDILLLCSDGLSNRVSDDVILNIVQHEDGLDQKANTLIELALDAGGDDNITVILCANEDYVSREEEQR